MRVGRSANPSCGPQRMGWVTLPTWSKKKRPNSAQPQRMNLWRLRSLSKSSRELILRGSHHYAAELPNETSSQSRRYWTRRITWSHRRFEGGVPTASTPNEHGSPTHPEPLGHLSRAPLEPVRVEISLASRSRSSRSSVDRARPALSSRPRYARRFSGSKDPGPPVVE